MEMENGDEKDKQGKKWGETKKRGCGSRRRTQSRRGGRSRDAADVKLRSSCRRTASRTGDETPTSSRMQELGAHGQGRPWRWRAEGGGNS